MPKQTAESYIAFPAVVPYPLIRFLGFAVKWFIILLCIASIPFTLYSCYGVLEQVAHSPKPAHTVLQHRRHIPSVTKGLRF